VRLPLRSVLVSLGLGLVGAAGLTAVPASAGNAVNVIVLREHGVGTGAAAQPYLDKFIAIAAQQNGWDPASKGQYETSRSNTDTWIKAQKPSYGIFSLAAFLVYKDQYNLEPIGSATMSTGGGQQYFVISKSVADINACKGKKLTSDHFDDTKFIERVVFERNYKLADFNVNEVKRRGQPMNEAINGTSDCSLIDDSQKAELGKLDPAGTVKVIWSSKPLPEPMVVAAFPSAPAAEKTAFQASLPKICPSNQQVCTDVGLKTLQTASSATYATVVALYK
jgi:hypothetical protein